MAADLGQRLAQQKVAQAKRSWSLGSLGPSRWVGQADDAEHRDLPQLIAAMVKLDALASEVNKALYQLLSFLRGVDDGTVESGSEIARKEGLYPTTANERLRLTRLVPSVVQAILAGQQPRTLSLIWLKNHELPWSWDGQETLFGGFDAGSAGVVAREPARASACRGRK
ncbi:hypothetical protein [Verminephrobacter eiseniae]|uniref:hypothetical protein n=1 Tax=Verminephrobacter eiseniae TaxID=364317 RepID=UPI002237EC35|nr:hypothetical protein [Verminephrobacter eiseniae]